MRQDVIVSKRYNASNDHGVAAGRIAQILARKESWSHLWRPPSGGGNNPTIDVRAYTAIRASATCSAV